MEPKTDHSTESRPDFWRYHWQNLFKKTKHLIPFVAGICAALLGLLFYNLIKPSEELLTMDDVNLAVEQAMASATPLPAYSSLVYQVIQPSLVFIQVAYPDSAEDEGALGSGVVISIQGEILTALHVVENAAEIQLTFADGTQTSAQVISTQPENDIAVLQPDRLPQILVPAVIGNPNSLEVGDEAYAVGNPFGLYSSMSSGVISGFNRSFEAEESNQNITGLIQIDTAVNPGNSGGPLLNRAGQVIGIVIGILNPTEEDFFVGIGFAVPITLASTAAGMPNY
ncbi:MAG: peptidase S1 [Chloroflexi bacterium HGW-Chloroflexi-10]|nr:MAG: peptidase S1 [Chloroflexi bacterium HGW-Chloroflexi-10]